LSEPAFDELLRRLADANVDFVVVGGLALNAWGVIRGTKDVDVVVSPEIENLRQVAAIAVEANGHVQEGEALLGSQFSIAAALADGAQVAIETDLGRLDVIQGLDGVPAFEELRSRATEAEMNARPGRPGGSRGARLTPHEPSCGALVALCAQDRLSPLAHGT
jgi:hypothetical protein